MSGSDEDGLWETLEEETAPPLLDEAPEEGLGDISSIVIINKRDHEDNPEYGADNVMRVLTIDFLAEFQEMVTELHCHDHITDVIFNISEPVPEFTIAVIEHGLGTLLPENLLSFYRLCNGFEFKWHYLDHKGDKKEGANIHFWDFGTVFGTWLDTLWKEDGNLSKKDADFLWTLRGLEYAQTNATHSMPKTSFSFTTYEDDIELHYLHDKKHIFKLETDFLDYMYWLLDTHGIPGWRVLMSDYNTLEDPLNIGVEKQFFDTFTWLFPDKDTSYYRERVQRFASGAHNAIRDGEES